MPRSGHFTVLIWRYEIRLCDPLFSPTQHYRFHGSFGGSLLENHCLGPPIHWLKIYDPVFFCVFERGMLHSCLSMSSSQEPRRPQPPCCCGLALYPTFFKCFTRSGGTVQIESAPIFSILDFFWSGPPLVALQHSWRFFLTYTLPLFT